jgi:hypothetical protein
MNRLEEHLRQMRREQAGSERLVREAPAGTALYELNQLAEAIMAKRPLLSWAAAFGQALTSRPDLYAAYQEQAGQR